MRVGHEISINNGWFPNLIFKKKIRKIPLFLTMKNDFKNQNFKIFEEVVNNCGRSDDDMTCEEIIISTRCIPINMTMVIFKHFGVSTFRESFA